MTSGSKRKLACVSLGVPAMVCGKGIQPKSVALKGAGHWHNRMPCLGQHDGCDQYEEIDPTPKKRPVAPEVHAKAPPDQAERVREAAAQKEGVKAE